MKNCELCRLPARIFCESDQAMLCWACDAKVHGANFLVARHSRSLLCHACQSPTPWTAAGEKLCHTFSVCESCVVRDESRDDDDGEDDESQGEGGNDNEFDSDIDEIDDEDGDLDGGDVDFDEDGDNQVVPTPLPPPPPSSTSSSSEEAENVVNNIDSVTATAISLKRIRENASDLRSPADLDRAFSRQRCGSALAAHTRRSEPDGGATLAVDSSRTRKDRRIDLNGPGSPSDPAIESEMRYRRPDTRKLSEESKAVDLDGSEGF